MILFALFWLLTSIGVFIRHKPEQDSDILNFIYLIIFSIIAPPIMIGIVITDYVMIRVKEAEEENTN